MAVRKLPPPDMSVAEVAALKRVTRRTVAGWIDDGELVATNVGTAGRTRLRVSAAALADFDRRRAVGAKPRKPRRPRQAATPTGDYF